MKRGFALLVALLLVTAVSATAFGDAFVVDDFTSTSDPSGAWSVDLGTPGGTTVVSQTAIETGLAGVAGGKRTTVMVSNPNPTNDNVSMGLSGGLFQMSTANDGLGQFSLKYEGMNADVTSQVYVNVAMNVDHLGSVVPSVMSVTLSDGTNTATVSKSWSELTTSGVMADYKFDLSDFLAASASLDLASIQSLQLDFLGDVACDLSIDSITIPEPATIALLGLGAVALIRRKK